MSIFGKLTLRTLRKNKSRTAITIVGVVLSAAMITAVSVFVSSLHTYMIKSTIANEGDWEALIYGLGADEAGEVSGREEIERSATIADLGWARVPGLKSDRLPYLTISAFSQEAYDMTPVTLLDGRLPQREGELVITNLFNANMEEEWKVGDTVTLEVGRRMSDGEELGPMDIYCIREDGEAAEELTGVHRETYEVVGICRRLGIESYQTPGYLALAWTEDAAREERVNLMVTLTDSREIYRFAKNLDAGSGYMFHDNLLIYEGVSDNSNFSQVIYRLAFVLIVLIMVGSVALIYNAFSISFSERTRQFGLLASVGATPRQLQRTVRLEAALISAVGIPIGVLSGIAGIGITLYLIGDTFLYVFGGSTSGVKLTLSVSPSAVLTAAAVSFVTVMLSAWIPSRRARRLSAIDAIRGQKDTYVGKRERKTGRLTLALFGVPGMLARKYFRRSRRKYRTTIVSLTLSVTLFISASALIALMKGSMGTVVNPPRADYVYIDYDGGSNIQWDVVDEAAAKFRSIPGITYSEACHTYSDMAVFPVSCLENLAEQDDGSRYLSVCAVSDEQMRALAQEKGLDGEMFLQSDQPHGLMYDGISALNPATMRYQKNYVITEKARTSGEPLDFTVSGVSVVGEGFLDEPPIEVEAMEITNLTLIVSNTQYQKFFAGVSDRIEHYVGIQAEADVDAYEAIRAVILEDPSLNDHGFLMDWREMSKRDRGMLLVINVFCYGFITLMTLISVVNVFNTITTNLQLRRRDFAMLRSVGMGQRGMLRMMNCECILYGVKALVFGLPLSILVTFGLYDALASGVEFRFTLPWNGILTASAGVFLVVFLSMLYAMQKIRRENVAEALKNENL